LSLLAASALTLAGCNGPESYPAQEGFDAAGSEDKAVTLANEVMERQGGYERWQQARYLAWTYYGSYHIWDKKLGLYRQEKGDRVILMSLNKPEGKVFSGGKRLTDPPQVQESLEQAYTIWRFASDFIVLPFRLKDPGVTLTYGGAGVTMMHDTADILDLVYHGTGPSGDGRNQLWINRKTHLVSQWAFYATPKEPKPAFVRDWLDYRNYNGLLIASQHNSASDTLTISHIAVLDTLPREIFFSARPVDKSEVMRWGQQKK
jgi:hypothetical protein